MTTYDIKTGEKYSKVLVQAASKGCLAFDTVVSLNDYNNVYNQTCNIVFPKRERKLGAIFSIILRISALVIIRRVKLYTNGSENWDVWTSTWQTGK